jgi:hypothetical protein
MHDTRIVKLMDDWENEFLDISIIQFSLIILVKVKQSHYRPGQGLEGSRCLRLPDFKTIGT